MIASWARTSRTFSTAINSIQLPALDPTTHYMSTKAAGWISKRARCRETPRPEDTRSYLLMSEPIPLRDGHSRRWPRRKGGGGEEVRWVEKLGRRRRRTVVACQATEKARSQLRVLCFQIQFVVIRTGPSFVRYVCSFFLARVSSAQPPTTTAFLSSFSRYTVRCQVYRSVVATCARDNQLSHATPSFVVRKWTNWRVRWLVNEGCLWRTKRLWVEGRSEGGKRMRMLRWILLLELKLTFILVAIIIDLFCIRLGLFDALNGKLLK